MKILRLCLLILGLQFVAGCRRDSMPTAAELTRFQRQSAHAKDASAAQFQTDLSSAYDSAGQRDARWDDPVRKAIRLIALAHGTHPVEGWQKLVVELVEQAVSQGCTDPYVRYIHLRYSLPNPRRTDLETAERLLAVARDLSGSGYPHHLRFYGCLRAAEALKSASTNQPPEIFEMRSTAFDHLVQALDEKKLAASQVYEMCNDLLEALRLNQPQYRVTVDALESRLFPHWGNSAEAHILRGRMHYELGWFARGTGYADSVTKEGWAVLARELAAAEKAFRKAWSLNPSQTETANWMLRVCLGQASSRAEMEKWFQRAMILSPDNYAACEHKLRYLDPKWHGSVEDLLRFGRECVTNRTFKGTVPAILVDAHDAVARYYSEPSERAAYYRQPQVWADIRGAFAEIARRDPNAKWFRNNLVWYAWKCSQWDDLGQLLKELDQPDYNYFGGQEVFDRIVADARAHAKK